MKINAFKQLKPDYRVSSPHWGTGQVAITRVETFTDPEANGTTATCFIETEDHHHVALDSLLVMRALKLHTAIPLYDDEREILNLDTHEIVWSEQEQDGDIYLTGTLYNFEAFDVILDGFGTEAEARRSIIEAIADQAENWAVNSNSFVVRHINII